MEDINLEKMWSEYDRKIEEAKIFNLQAWVISIQTFEYLQTHKMNTELKNLSRFKGRVALVGVIWILFLGILVYGNGWKNIFFSISLSMIILFTGIAIFVYIRHIILIRQINYSESIIDSQQKLAELQASTLRIGKILWLQMPFYTSWWWNMEWIKQDTANFIFISVPIFMLFSYFAIWLYRNINYRNRDKKWFRFLFNSPEWLTVIKAMKYIKEIEEFKKG